LRLWSVHPRYLDVKGLVACWREGLLARKVLKGETKGYRNHPQLDRFKVHHEPVAVLDSYLSFIWEEARGRGYAFNLAKIGPSFSAMKLTVTTAQLEYEFQFLKDKLRVRAPECYKELVHISSPLSHPLFRVVQGPLEPWERVPAQKPAGSQRLYRLP